MNSKKAHKLSKATVATVLAVSGVVIALPHPTQAYMFSDLNPQADYYQPIVDLYNKNIAIGYTDGKFKPNQAITRGEAAEMLALAIGINTRNVSNPMFSDVPASNKYYKYVAALAKEGIINGFQDKTFRLDEPITRGQMSKIITLGYKLGVSSKLNHGFKDVSGQNGNAYFIQTLFDLKITKGKTPVAFEPFSSVTRGQMATFVWRAGQADAGDPVYNVGDITGEKMYINGVAYTIAPSLRSVFNTSNKRVLKDAAVEGTFSGTTLTSVSKLTINASGTSSSLLALDGDFTSFTGQLVINGSYLRLKNWTLTGKVTIAETPRRSLAHADMTTKASIFNTRIASLNGFGFINWDKPTDSKDETPNSTVNETLKPKPIDTNKYTPYNLRMPKIDRYVDFSNSIISNLHIEQSNTFISAQETINRLTVARDVANFELYADATALYIDTDVNLTMYGVNDIRYVYKNSSKSVNFYTDSYYDFLYVSNGSGWIDLGEDVYIDEVILPKKKSPNDIFNDYENDNGNIGHIEDEDGNIVDRDPVENSIIPDATAPAITRLTVEPGGSTATVRLTADEDSTYYYLVLEESQRAPSISEIKALGGQYSGKGSLTMDEEVQFTVANLEQMTDYVIYVVVIDDAENVSDREDAAFSTKDGTAPSIRQLKAEGMNGGKRARINFTPTELGAYGYLIVGADAPAPTADEVWSKGKRTVLKNADLDGVEFVDNTLSPNTMYVVYMVMDDVSGNRSPIVKSNTFATGALDVTPPEVVSMAVTEMLKDPTKVLITFNEKLDKATAENIANYELGGTGNLTGKPFKATLSKDGKGVTLEIPSMAAFVFNDTLTVKIEKVEDEAGNQIVETTQVYTYKAVENPDPKISGLKVNSAGPNNSAYITNEVLFTANAAGSYYYLIIPKDPTNTLPKPERADIFFPEEYLVKNASLINFSISGNGNAVPTENTFRVKEIDRNDPKFKSHPYGYDIYVAFQDRNGNFAPPIPSTTFINDESAPSIVSFKYQGGSASSTGPAPAPPITYREDEFYFAVESNGEFNNTKKYFKYELKFDELMDKATAETTTNYLLDGKAKGKVNIVKAELQEDKQTVILTLEALASTTDRTLDYEYNLLEGEKLTIGLKKGAIYDATKSNTVGEYTREFTYRDLIKPKLRNTIAFNVKQEGDLEIDKKGNNLFDDDDYVLNDGKITLELTFTEAIKAETLKAASGAYNFNVTMGDTNTNITSSVLAAEVVSDTPNKVRITIERDFFNDEDKFTVDFNTRLTNRITDIAGNAVATINADDYKAIYQYRALPLDIYGLQMKNPTTISGKPISKVLQLSVTTQYYFTDITVYYAVASRERKDMYPDMIINPKDYPYSTIYDSKPLKGPTGGYEFVAPGSEEFQQGQKIYIILSDKYGNVSEIYYGSI